MAEELKTPEMLSLLDCNEESLEQLSEHLAVIREVRSELVKSYNEMNNLKKSNEELSNELVTTSKTIESLTKELNAYKARDAEVERLNELKRLEQLSANFRKLGQERSVEELSKLDKAIVSEFETITSLALDKKSTEMLDSVTVPTQSMHTKRVEVVTPAAKGNMFAGICNTLSANQGKSDKNKLLYL